MRGLIRTEWRTIAGLAAGVFLLAASALADVGAPENTRPAHSAADLRDEPSQSTGETAGGLLPGSPAAAPRGTIRATLVEGREARATDAGVTARLKGSSHEPVTGGRWTVEVRAERYGRPVDGTVKLEAVNGSAVVGQIAVKRLTDGTARHTMRWPAQAVGHRLSVRATVDAGGGVLLFTYPLRVASA